MCFSKKKIILLSLSCTLGTFPERAELWGDFKRLSMDVFQDSSSMAESTSYEI